MNVLYYKRIICIIIFISCLKCNLCVQDSNLLVNNDYCVIGDENIECKKYDRDKHKSNNIYVFYDVNPAEGFNLRRDVYMRMAVLAHNLKKTDRYHNIKLVLPPFSNLYHWQSRDVGSQDKIPWNLFFDVKSLQSFAPVIETYDVFMEEKKIVFDRIYVLQNYENAFENGNFEDKWETSANACEFYNNFWGYQNITYKNVECVNFQGSISMLREIMDFHPEDKMIIFINAQIPLHDEYGSKKYWDARKSMKFNSELISVAEMFIQDQLGCFKTKCDNYISVHWRRRDFAKYRSKEVPSIGSAARQIFKIKEREYKSLIKTVFIATDATKDELKMLADLLIDINVNVKWFTPSEEIKLKYKDGGVAIIEQIICSHAVYFVGTHESTFSFRIQEEREILGFNSKTTFNRLCPDSGSCERPSRWKIVN